MRSTRVRGTSMALASAPDDRPSGMRNSSRKISPGWSGGSRLGCRLTMGCSGLVVIDDFDVGWSFGCPVKADAELVVDAYRILPFAIAAERFQTIGRRHPKVAQVGRGIEIVKLTAGDLDQI